MQQIQPFSNEVSVGISRQLWLPLASIPPGEWKELGRGGRGNCRTLDSGAEVHPEFQLPLDRLEEGDQDQPVLRARRYRLYPTTEEKEILVRWIGAARWTFNECLRAIKDEGIPKSKKALRARAINDDAVASL
ncbi:hypothetical protein V1517DRAFT_136264 [Lipomyces orientalis]|uniref:Uncharacterized protein n=1 Tax=Lipomyces orientalis TaxID=1233043 RepID=A0ACC3TN01_9ASCO